MLTSLGLKVHKPVLQGSGWQQTQDNRRIVWWECLVTPRFTLPADADFATAVEPLLNSIFASLADAIRADVKRAQDGQYYIPARIIDQWDGSVSHLAPSKSFVYGTMPTLYRDDNVSHDAVGQRTVASHDYYAYCHLSADVVYQPPVTVDFLTPQKMLDRADALAKELCHHDALDRQFILAKLHEENVVMHSLVKDKYMQLRSSFMG